jgi:type VI secretion system protein ImpG
MASDANTDLLRYYQAELAYLRNEGAGFARRYPKVAGRLDLDGSGSTDPQIERLLESFAFLTGRLQRNFDAEFPEIPAALLSVLYPHLVAPVPSMAIARFNADPEQSRALMGHTVPQSTTLFATAEDGVTCRFRSCYPVTLWPVEIAAADWIDPASLDFLDGRPEIAKVLRIELACLGKRSFSEFAPDRLRFFLDGDRGVTARLYELIFNHARGIAIRPGGTEMPTADLPANAIEPVGFEVADQVLPHPPEAHQGYRLLQEYFTFPDKFLFFDLAGLGGFGTGTRAEILILLDQRDGPAIEACNFRLGCTPVVNLFRRTSEPVRLDQTSTDYRLVPDLRFERSTEIHSVLSVSFTSNFEEESRHIQPFFSYSHAAGQRGDAAFWTARRDLSERADLTGTDLLLSFVDLNFSAARPAGQVVFADTLCTNRGVAEQIPAGTPFEIEIDVPVKSIDCLTRPSRQIAPPLRGATLWRLISHLSLNHLSLAGGPGSLDALREILRLYAGEGSAALDAQLQGLRGLETRRLMRRIAGSGGHGFCRGTEITLDLDESQFTGASAFLLSAVLSRFFALYAAINSFTQLAVTSRQRSGLWKTWEARAGEAIIL